MKTSFSYWTSQALALTKYSLSTNDYVSLFIVIQIIYLQLFKTNDHNIKYNIKTFYARINGLIDFDC